MDELGGTCWPEFWRFMLLSESLVYLDCITYIYNFSNVIYIIYIGQSSGGAHWNPTFSKTLCKDLAKVVAITSLPTIKNAEKRIYDFQMHLKYIYHHLLFFGVIEVKVHQVHFEHKLLLTIYLYAHSCWNHKSLYFMGKSNVIQGAITGFSHFVANGYIAIAI